MKIYKSTTELVGNTPLVELSSLSTKKGIDARILAKIELFNPAGSAKDRVALRMIEDAEKSGKLTTGSVIIEPTSGNTGIALAMIARAKGYKCIIVMPDSMSEERRRLMRAYGADLILTDGRLGMKGAVDKAIEISKSIPNSFIPSQFDNPSNPEAHKSTTGPEIWEDTEGRVDILVACVGTGGTLSGTATYLKSKNPSIKIIAVEPASSPLLSKGYAGAHKIQGIGANFVPENLDSTIIDEIVTVENEDAYKCAKELVATEGILAGISSGAALCASIQVAQRPESKGKTIVTILPDSGERYLSTPDFI